MGGTHCLNTGDLEPVLRIREDRIIRSKGHAWETRYPVGSTDSNKSASRLSEGDMEVQAPQQPTLSQGGRKDECCLKRTDLETRRNGCIPARVMARGVRK
jgi:hypothetical protein